MVSNRRYVVEDEGRKGEAHGAFSQDALVRMKVRLGVGAGVGCHEVTSPHIARQFFFPSVSWTLPVNIEHDVAEFMKHGECGRQEGQVKSCLVLHVFQSIPIRAWSRQVRRPSDSQSIPRIDKTIDGCATLLVITLDRRKFTIDMNELVNLLVSYERPDYMR